MYQQTCIPIAFDWLMSSRMTQPTKGGNAMEGVEVPWVRRRGPQTKAQGGTKGQTARIEKSNRSSYRQEKTHPGNCPSIQDGDGPFHLDESGTTSHVATWTVQNMRFRQSM
eukprot:g26302.t1